ncbi:LytR family transcriptional regulator [Actinomycetaceae bacterium WB03_NA08]|uniref:LytR family transcriptional regulator n=1 Tax=Scrofimicrobium canadense TaxID=2652290 RepID=A0A6N7W5G1_9ACTO|nr:LytR C-terminal domain-containing protein [Scrofimicrobium canadense]MSS83368.1 LytR family transcriptional regulator [Scrofimicrobium canadense]
MSSQYPTDEFDNPPSDGPVGVHRKPASPWRPVIPFLVILLVVPLLAWGFSEFLMWGSKDKPAVSAPQSQQSAAPTPSQPEQQQSSTTPVPDPLPTEPEQQTSPEQPTPSDGDVNPAATIEVLNVAGVDGWAGQVVSQLAENGFNQSTAGNLDWSPTEGNSIRYQSAEDEPTAKKIGEILGISDIALDPESSNTHAVTVFLVVP